MTLIPVSGPPALSFLRPKFSPQSMGTADLVGRPLFRQTHWRGTLSHEGPGSCVVLSSCPSSGWFVDVSWMCLSSPAVLAYIVNATCVNTTVSILQEKAAHTGPVKAALSFRFTDAVQPMRPRPNHWRG